MESSPVSLNRSLDHVDHRFLQRHVQHQPVRIQVHPRYPFLLLHLCNQCINHRIRIFSRWVSASTTMDRNRRKVSKGKRDKLVSSRATKLAVEGFRKDFEIKSLSLPLLLSPSFSLFSLSSFFVFSPDFSHSFHSKSTMIHVVNERLL